ncbi:MAG: hypothetical protein AVDCRST_MAG49-3175 [uncultured Thermomicrobiales bacterium]|uniref:Uncharacterized protein n=1 Tax=uncultured Thermomicrobiales bacterium TaxID=1645740 RepID=A0A6J4V9B6_9BACT|nr:MAG: hypothetical protein AVDCRST_MAG49-3175 [uncultured Thermomicrobiales bacterium]
MARRDDGRRADAAGVRGIGASPRRGQDGTREGSLTEASRTRR